eukprot:COSAG05_NODE_378_length_10601_cov_10.955437_3_plen_239_part_00
MRQLGNSSGHWNPQLWLVTFGASAAHVYRFKETFKDLGDGIAKAHANIAELQAQQERREAEAAANTAGMMRGSVERSSLNSGIRFSSCCADQRSVCNNSVLRVDSDQLRGCCDVGSPGSPVGSLDEFSKEAAAELDPVQAAAIAAREFAAVNSGVDSGPSAPMTRTRSGSGVALRSLSDSRRLSGAGMPMEGGLGTIFSMDATGTSQDWTTSQVRTPYQAPFRALHGSVNAWKLIVVW